MISILRSGVRKLRHGENENGTSSDYREREKVLFGLRNGFHGGYEALTQ
jgi:hypothetical protein